ncbi:hypothetical protein KC345_g1622 [Hortaea werneckii]|nr:hypothetical protein KC345_g1622 [Hortaea werneckii]
MSHANGDSPAIGGLLEGLSFFLVQRLPSRSNFVDKIKANGGRVVKLEQQADYVIADHVRKDCPPGSISYTLIDSAIRNGVVPDPEDHRAGPPVGSIRDVASSVPGKQTRRAFTAEDDTILWQWVQKAEEQGGSVKGNDIYKHLEAHNPRHTFQAWRDRYIKKLMGNPPAGCVRSSASPAASKARDGQRSASEEQGRAGATKEQRRTPNDSPESESNALERKEFKLPRSSQQASSKPAASQSPKKQGVPAPEFDETDFEALMGEAEDIYRLHKSQVRDAWKAWADAFPKHSAKRWRKFWEDQVKPEYLRRLEAEENGESSSDAEEVSETKNLKRKRPAEEQTTAESPRAKIKPPASPKNGADDFSNRERKNSSNSRHESETQQPPLASLRPISIASTEGEQEDAMPRQNGASGGQPMNVGVAQQSDFLTSEANRAAEQQLRLEHDPESAETSDSRRKVGDTDLVPGPSQQNKNGIQGDSHNVEANEDSRGVSQPQRANVSRQNPSIDEEANAGLHARISMKGNGFGQHDYEAKVEGSDSASQSLDSQAAQAEDVVISNHLVEDGEAEDELRSNEMIDPDLTGDPLTEANLASQHSLQKGHQLRGVDLPEDEQDQDQTDFATYLQNLVPQGQSAHEQGDDGEEFGLATMKGAQGKDQGNSAEFLRNLFKKGKAPEHWANGTSLKPADRSSLPQEDGEMINQTTYTHNETVPEDLPLSSQQEIDDVIEANSHWPSSPDASHREEPSQKTSQNLSMAFETQIQHPRVPSEESEAEGQADEDMFMTQPPVAEGAHGSLPRSPAMRAHDDINTGLYFSSPVRENDRQAGFRDRIDRGETPETQEEDEQEGQGSREGYIDLSIAEPDGGFDLSSPVKSTPAERQEGIKGQHAPVANADGKHAFTGFAEDGTAGNPFNSSHHAPNIEDEDEDDDMRMEQEVPTALRQETIEVSSTSSSSSSSQDAEEERVVDPHVANTRTSRHDAPDTQEILDAETQKPDFAMPLPPDSQEDDDEPDMEDDLPEYPLDFQPNQRPSNASQQQRHDYETEIEPPTRSRRLGTQPARENSRPAAPSSQPPRRGTSRLPPPSAQRRRPQPLTRTPASQPLATDAEIDTFLTTMLVRYACADSTAIAALKCTSMRPDLAELVVLESKAGRGLPEDIPGVWTEAEDRALEGGDARLLRRVEARHGWEEVMARLEFLGEWRAVGVGG